MVKKMKLKIEKKRTQKSNYVKHKNNQKELLIKSEINQIMIKEVIKYKKIRRKNNK